MTLDKRLVDEVIRLTHRLKSKHKKTVSYKNLKQK